MLPVRTPCALLPMTDITKTAQDEKKPTANLCRSVQVFLNGQDFRDCLTAVAQLSVIFITDTAWQQHGACVWDGL